MFPSLKPVNLNPAEVHHPSMIHSSESCATIWHTELSAVLWFWVNYNDLTVLPHWNHGFYRGIIPFYGPRFQVCELLYAQRLENQPVWVSQSDRFTTRTGEDGPIWTDQIRRLQILVVISCYIHIMWLKQCHVYHPPVITIFIGGVNHSQSWVVYDCFNHINDINPDISVPSTVSICRDLLYLFAAQWN